MSKSPCGECTQCCIVFEIPEVETPCNTACKHLHSRIGCKIYNRRPQVCRDFECGYTTWWMKDRTIDPELRPDHSGIIVTFRLNQDGMFLMMRECYPDAWSKASDKFKKWIDWLLLNQDVPLDLYLMKNDGKTMERLR